MIPVAIELSGVGRFPSGAAVGVASGDDRGTSTRAGQLNIFSEQ